MAIKRESIVTYFEVLLIIKSLITRIHFTTMSMATKPDSMVTRHVGLLAIELNNALITQSSKVT